MDTWPPPPKKKDAFVKKAGEARNKSYVDRFEELAAELNGAIFTDDENDPEILKKKAEEEAKEDSADIPSKKS